MTTLRGDAASGRSFDDVDGLPAEVTLDGLPKYPRFADDDFERAFSRFNILTGVEEAFGELEESQLAEDGASFPDLARFGTRTGHYILPAGRSTSCRR